VIYGTKAFLPPMLKQREGCIVNISSVFGLVATPGSVAYTISKFGVRGLTETLWQELDGSEVRADYAVLGLSVPQKHSFYGLPWFTGMIGADRVTGPTIAQACATGVRTVLAATQEIQSGLSEVALVVTDDRTSNGPHLYYPNPGARAVG
jgi:acetyl-CoA acetyltransferase